MRKTSLICIALSLAALCGATLAAGLDENPLYRAMQDELDRSMQQLKLKELAGPYYLAYRVEDSQTAYMKAVFGAVVIDEIYRQRELHVDLRVGDYALDNSNFLVFSRHDSPALLPLEDNYAVFRHIIWLKTDRAYKQALETLAKKKAVIENRMLKDRLNDFCRTEPTTVIEPAVTLNLDRDACRAEIKTISSLFKEFPDIQTSQIAFSVSADNQYFVDSEGSVHLRAKLTACIRADVSVQDADGNVISDSREFFSDNPEKLFEQTDRIMTDLRHMAGALTERITAHKAEAYMGPVLFTDQGAAQFFYQVLGRGVVHAMEPLLEDERYSHYFRSDDTGFLNGKVGYRILPPTFTVVADPTVNRLNGRFLAGAFSVDDQGVRAQKVTLVEQGKLAAILMARTPGKKMKKSNGYAYVNSSGSVKVRLGNLMVSAKDGIAPEDVRTQLIDACKDMGLEYGIMVTRLQTPRANRMVFFRTGAPQDEKPLLSAPLTAYKVYTNGRVEPLRGLAFANVTPRVLKDIISQSDRQNTLNFTTMEGFRRGRPTSVTAPDVLIEEMELVADDSRPQKPPYLDHPYFAKEGE